MIKHNVSIVEFYGKEKEVPSLLRMWSDGFSASDIGSMLGIKRDSVYSAIKRAKKKFPNTIPNRHIKNPALYETPNNKDGRKDA